MQTVKITLLVFVCLALLGACGLKGPLYLPEETPAVDQASTPDTDAEEDKENGAKKETVAS